jgi:hypothetical protein
MLVLLLVLHDWNTLVKFLFKHRSEIKVFPWSYIYLLPICDKLCVLAS